jgi:hypothetical protein
MNVSSNQQPSQVAKGYYLLRTMRRLLVSANVPRSPILVTLMMGALRSTETSVLTRVTRSNIPEDSNLHSLFLGLTELYQRQSNNNIV